MIGDALRMDIENYAGRRRHNPLFAMAEAGTLTPAIVARYLSSVRFMIRHTPLHLGRARERAGELGDRMLAAHFESKLAEEVGHDVWADRDLAGLEARARGAASLAAAPSAVALARYLEALIERDPALYLTYIAFAEYVTVVVGPEWMALVERNCGIAPSAMTVIANHVELDRAHAEEGFAVMDDLVGDPRKLTPLRDAMAGAIRLYDAYCGEVCVSSSDEAAEQNHVSAA